jgi:hypothetical protein
MGAGFGPDPGRMFVAGADAGYANPALRFRPTASASRNSVYGPGILNWDLSLGKNFSFSETRRLQFRAEFFNAFNQVNFDRPSNSVSSSSFGRVSNAADGRSIQFGLKFYW